MRFKKLFIASFLAMIMLGLPFTYANSLVSEVMVVNAESLEDDLDYEESRVENDNGVADYFKGFTPMTPEHLEVASETLSPITNFFGYIMGGGLVLLGGGLFLTTVLDLIYIGVPLTRGILYKGAQDDMQGGSMGSMGGYGGGYGGRMGQQKGLRNQLISDEAVQCSMLIGSGQQSAGGGMPGGYGGIQSPQNEMSTKSVILAYLKKRSVFLIVIAICMVILTSSVLLDTGINIALWAMKMIELVNNSIPTL